MRFLTFGGPRLRSQRYQALVLAALVAASLPLVACGNQGPAATGSSPARSGTADLAKAKQQVQHYYRGTHASPPTTAPAPVKGKHLWMVSVGNASFFPKVVADKVVQGANRLGWKVTVVDGKFDPTVQLAGLRDAIAAKADGIYVYGSDCPPLRSGLSEAKRAGIPVVASEGADCNELHKGAPSLFTWVTRYSEGTFLDWVAAWGTAQAAWMIAHTRGKAKVIVFKETDIQSTIATADSFVERLEQCPGCKVVDTVEFTGRDFGPPLQEKAQQALLQHPEATVVYPNYDAPVISGIAAAVRASGRNLTVLGGEGSPANLELIRQGRQGFALGFVSGWEGYSALDAFVRIFAGEKPTKRTGFGIQLVDKQHGLPSRIEARKGYQSAVDWEKIYATVWGVR